jgi:hypothetical protein
MSAEQKDVRDLIHRFPTARARLAADLATDALPVTATMVEYIDTWIAAYRKAGGKEPQHAD